MLLASSTAIAASKTCSFPSLQSQLVSVQADTGIDPSTAFGSPEAYGTRLEAAVFPAQVLPILFAKKLDNLESALLHD